MKWVNLGILFLNQIGEILPKFFVVSYHTNTWGCGIAKFNELVSGLLQTATIPFRDWADNKMQNCILSINLKEFSKHDLQTLDEVLHSKISYSVIFHGFDSSSIEIKLAQGAKSVLALDAFTYSSLRKCGVEANVTSVPSMLRDFEFNSGSEFKLFTFGMAHKIHHKLLAKLFENFRSIRVTPTVYMSTALHVGEQPLDKLEDEVNAMQLEFGVNFRFLGFLSDWELSNQLQRSNAVFRFYPGGARSNSTSLMAALKLGCPTITNLDEYSPHWLVHERNVIDINQWRKGNMLPTNVGVNARRDYERSSNWDDLSKAVHKMINEEM